METKLFDFSRFDIKLETVVLGRDFVYLDETDSTNTYLLSEEGDDKPNGTVCFAEKQNKGRGRLERTWSSLKSNNLTFSILINDSDFIAKYLNFINLGTSLAIAQALETLFQFTPELKWPNDVLVNGKKISGILLESSSRGNSFNKLVVGIGVNVNQPVFHGEYNLTPTSVRLELGTLIDRERLLAEILNNLEEVYSTFKDGTDYVLNQWRNRCKMIGEKVTVRDGDKELYGIFTEIDDNGYILLQTERDEFQTINFGDVSVHL